MSATHNLLPTDGSAHLYPEFLSPSAADGLMQRIEQQTNWTQREIIIFGKAVMQPRLMAWYGDREYCYSGISLAPVNWHPTLLNLKSTIEQQCAARFNTALLNLYRNGEDSMGWHQDNEQSLGEQPVIASLSLGVERKFKFKHIDNKCMNVDINLAHGSLLIMAGLTQHKWKHCLPKTRRSIGTRINITFRNVLGD
tara:strand:+ start:2461 stop:3048 length:588 start_codon:yes stop_codon:yes gene_type:complete